LPYEEFSGYYIWNEAQKLFELMCASGKEPDHVTSATFSKFSRIPGFTKNNQSFKADLEICFKNMQRKYECVFLDIHSFFEVLETLCVKVFRPKVIAEDEVEMTVAECLELFLAEAIPYFSE
jgi:hypothetical protein